LSPCGETQLLLTEKSYFALSLTAVG
jgi:hypothetical protein